MKVEMGWKVNSTANLLYDLDASTFLLGEDGQIENEADFVFYGSNNRIQAVDEFGQLRFDGNGDLITRPLSLDQSVLGSIDDIGDDENNSGEGNEEIDVDLTKTAPHIKEILFTVSIYFNPNDPNDPRSKFNFGQVRDAFIQIKNSLTGEILYRYDLDEDFSTTKGVEFGRLYRLGSNWKFQAMGDSHKDGLGEICQKYASKFM